MTPPPRPGLRYPLAFLSEKIGVYNTMALACGVAAALFLVGLDNHALWDYHEPYVGGIIQEMAAGGRWIVPTLNGQPYLEKPPLHYLLGVASTALAGTYDPWALRLPSALMAIGTVAWITWLGCRLQSARAGLWGGLLAATHVLFFRMGHQAVVDITLTAALSGTLGLALLALAEPERGLWVQLFWASLGPLFLAKGVIGPAMALWAVAFLLAVDRGAIRRFLRPGWGQGAGLALILAWVLPLALQGGRAHLSEVFLRNTLGRFLERADLVPRTGRLDEHREPVLFYLGRTPGNLLPWVGIWCASLVPGGWRGVRSWGIPVVLAATLALLTASSEKRMVYLLPVLPLSFLHTGLWLDRVLDRGPGVLARGAIRATLVLALVLGAGMPWFVVARVGMPWPEALAMALPALGLGAASLAMAARGRLEGALRWTLAQWVVTLLLFMVVAVPHLDREWNPILEPYLEAKKLEEQGAMVIQGRLEETQVGFANLTFGRTLPRVEDAQAVREALAQPGPVALLLEPRHFWRGELRAQAEGAVEIPTEASRSKRLRDRTPVLLLNRRAVDLLD
ncbi:ArnT family glycosyltransferase [Mesoterricola silvestris]|uniref:Glycosyltransferase RgtA/B/C/D-like domain-containing protein n=1 Tax=Mesoterricola silvestris TaxID=2927979 RepID=A0AA48GJQ3_9BACT|nr:glycosyltransferase family 39 protein [Mesoterricola silvestris]BDU70994.1 hypothetical protein METEAL_01680 [Mesoterricola silvestris]